MQFTIDRLSVEITMKNCDIPEDERARLQTTLSALGEDVKDFAEPTLAVHVVYHPRIERFHVEFKLRLSGRALFTGEEDSYLDTALQRGLAKLKRKVEAYKENPDEEARAERQAYLDSDVIAPESPDAGPLAKAAAAGDYRTFRTGLAGYEEWLRKRVGGLVQRTPRLRHGLAKSCCWATWSRRCI